MRKPPNAPKPTVYSIGYTGFPVDALCQFIEDHNLRVVDVRWRPFSRNAVYNKQALATRLGSRYVHLPALGNLNYKGGAIQLSNEALGLDQLRALLEDGPIALLCVCSDPAVCHRTTITERLAREGYPIEHVSASGESDLRRLPLFA